MSEGSTCTLHAPSISALIEDYLPGNRFNLSLDVIEEGLRCPDHPELFLSASMYFLHEKLRKKLRTTSSTVNKSIDKRKVKIFRSGENVNPSSDTAISLSMLFSTMYPGDGLGSNDIQQKTFRRVGSTQSLPVPAKNTKHSYLLLSKYVANVPYKQYIALQNTEKYDALLQSESAKPKKKLKLKQILPVPKKCNTRFRGFFNKFRKSRNLKRSNAQINELTSSFSPNSTSSSLSDSEQIKTSVNDNSFEDLLLFRNSARNNVDYCSEFGLISTSCSKIYNILNTSKETVHSTQEKLVSVEDTKCLPGSTQKDTSITIPDMTNDSRFHRQRLEIKKSRKLEFASSEAQGTPEKENKKNDDTNNLFPIKIRYVCKIPKNFKQLKENSSSIRVQQSESVIVQKTVSVHTDLKSTEESHPKLKLPRKKSPNHGKMLATKPTVVNLTNLTPSGCKVRESTSKLSVCYEDGMTDSIKLLHGGTKPQLRFTRMIYRQDSMESDVGKKQNRKSSHGHRQARGESNIDSGKKGKRNHTNFSKTPTAHHVHSHLDHSEVISQDLSSDLSL